MSGEICPHCGARMKEWWHSLTPGLVEILIKVLKSVKASGVNDYHLQVNGELNNNEFSNFPKLRVHALVARVKDAAGNRVAAHWLITDRGGQFLRGELAVPHKVKTYRGKVIGHSEDLVKIHDFRNKIPEFETVFDFEIHEGRILTKVGQKEEQQKQLFN